MKILFTFLTAKKTLFWTNNKFVYLIFINKLLWYHPKITYENIVQKEPIIDMGVCSTCLFTKYLCILGKIGFKNFHHFFRIHLVDLWCFTLTMLKTKMIWVWNVVSALLCSIVMTQIGTGFQNSMDRKDLCHLVLSTL